MRLWLSYMLEAIWLNCKNMQNLEILDIFEILITQKLLKCPKDPFVRSALICEYYKKVSKGTKIRNRYNQAPHPTQDTNGRVTNSQLDTTNESQEAALSHQVTSQNI